jgi:hypothetical protein
MFETLVLVCLLGTTDTCQALSDLNGPYKTKAECTARAYEIAYQLPIHMPNYVAVKYKCVKAEENLEGKINTSYGREKEET